MRNQRMSTIMLFLLSISFSNSVFGQNIGQNSDEYKFFFKTKSSILERIFCNNSITLNNLDSSISSNLSDIKNETAHIEITGYIIKDKTDDLNSLNEISLQASVVRAYLITKYGLGNNCFIYNIDTSLYVSNIIGVTIRSYSVPIGVNKDIFYTFNPSAISLYNVFIQYDSIPYKQKITLLNTKITEEPILKIANMRGRADCILTGFAIPYKTNQHLDFNKINLGTVPPVIKIVKNINQRALRPYVAIKTNAIFWAGFSPSLERGRRDYIPNIEMEFYFANRFSISMDGFFAPIDRKTSGTEWCYKDGIAIEQRIWLSNKGINRGAYRGYYAGIYGTTGEFDILQQSLGVLGYTGDYYGAGISIGFVQPLFRSGLAIEVGARGGYRIDNWESYEADNGSYYFVDSGTQKGFKLQGLRLSIMYRFGRRIMNIV
ncbi:MAG: DUF3575 domain-containing protein [Bacteroidales bacterium]